MTTERPAEVPVVAEVRKTRAALIRKGGGTLDGLFEAARAEAELARPSAQWAKPATRRRPA